jgi:hypothetical protein
MGIVSWRGMAAAVLLIAGAAPALADPPPPVRATIGDLTFTYNRFNWRIDQVATGLTATCLQIDCRGVVFDVSVRDAHGECTKDSVRATAERLFPTKRHAVNVLPAERFGLVMAESRNGAALRSPTYVHACLDWQDREYRFAMRPETVGETSWAGGALHYLVSRATAPPAKTGMLRLRALELPYPTDIWRASEMAPGQSYRLACLPPTCRGEGEFVTVVAEPSEVGCTFDRLDVEGWDYVDTEVTPMVSDRPNAPAFSFGITHSPCRNWVPSRRVACAWHGGVAYNIIAPGGVGCKSSFGIPDDAFENLVSGARLVPAP